MHDKPATFQQLQTLVGRGFDRMTLVGCTSKEAQRAIHSTRHLEGSPLRSRERYDGDRYSWQR